MKAAREFILVIASVAVFGAAHNLMAQETTWYVCIDPGHGGSKSGAVGYYYDGGVQYTVLEKDVNLKVALSLRDSLIAIGNADPENNIIVAMTRTTDVNPDWPDRVNPSNEQDNGNPGDMYISIHHNAPQPPVDTNINGTEVIWSSNMTTDSDVWRENVDWLAERVYAALGDHFQGFAKRERTWYDAGSSYYVLRNTETYSTLSEAQFTTNPPQARLYDDPTSGHVENEAGAIARGIYHFILDDPFVTIASNIPNLEFIVEDSVYIGAYYGNWFHGVEYYVSLPEYWGNKYFCGWEDDAAASPVRTIWCCTEDSYMATYLSPSSVALHSPTAGLAVEEGASLQIHWEADFDQTITTSRTILLSRDGGATYPWAIVNGSPIAATGHGYDYWTVSEPYSDNCRIVINIYGDLQCMTASDTSGVFGIVPEPPPAPGNLRTSTCGNNFLIKFNWNPVVVADSYYVYRDGAWIATKPAGITEHIDVGLTPAQTYEYEVESVYYNLTSSRAGPVSRVTGAGPPAAPTNLQVTQIQDCVFRFSWQDNSVNEDNFAIRVEYYDDQGVWHQNDHGAPANATWKDCGFYFDNFSATARVIAREVYMDCQPPNDILYAQSSPSNSAYFSNGICPEPEGCPVVHVYDGNEYIRDNTILATSEKKIGEAVSGFNRYMIDRPLRPDKDGHYRLRIEETEKEISKFDAVRLIGLQCPEGGSVALNVDGTPVLYSNAVAPISCVDHHGFPITDLVSTRDRRFYACEEPGYLIAEFRCSSAGHLQKGCEMDCQGGNCEIPPKGEGDPEMDKTNPDVADSFVKPGNMLTVEALGSDSSWSLIAEIPPRARNTGPVFFNTGEYLDPFGGLTLKYSWEHRYVTDQVALFSIDKTSAVQTIGRLINARDMKSHSLAPLLQSVDSVVATLRPGEAWELVFAFNDPGTFDAFILESYGHYNPALPGCLSETTDSSASPVSADEFQLTNSPNPFNAGTQIHFYLPRAGHVRLEVYDVLGRQVKTLVDGHMPVGRHTATWIGINESGVPVASGIYLCKLAADEMALTRKMSLVK